MTNGNLDRSIRAIVGDARPTPEAEAAMDDAFAAIAQEAAARSPAPSTSRRRPAPVLVPRWARAAAVACAVCLGVGGTAYAADALGLINLQQSGDYQTLMAVDAGEVAAPATGPVADYRLEFANLPEGAAAFDRDNHLAKYDWADHEKGFSAFLFYLDSSEPLPVSFTTGATPVSVNGAEGVVFEKPGIAQGDHSLDMYLVFPDEQRVLWLWTQLAHLRRADPHRRGRVPYSHRHQGHPWQRRAPPRLVQRRSPRRGAPARRPKPQSSSLMLALKR